VAGENGLVRLSGFPEIDLTTYAGNVAEAEVLYDREGNVPRRWSAGCWKI
jgi:hypothetical protein